MNAIPKLLDKKKTPTEITPLKSVNQLNNLKIA